jgi:hypothetical protein
MSFCGDTNSKAAPFIRQQLPVHTQPFAFRAYEEDDESVKMSNITNRRASVVIPALPAPRPQLKHAQNNNFYSIQISPFLPAPNFELTENKTLPFFYLIQMNSHQSLITSRQSPLTNHQLPITKTRRIP